MVSKTRTVRIGERIREDLSELIQRDVNDPRLTGLTITDVIVDRELMYADVYVSALVGSSHSSQILHGLDHAQGFLRSELARKINLRHFPRLRFHWDATLEKGERIDRLITQLQTESHQPDLENNAGNDI